MGETRALATRLSSSVATWKITTVSGTWFGIFTLFSYDLRACMNYAKR